MKKKKRRRKEEGEVECNGNAEIRKSKFSAVGEACEITV